MDDRIAPTPDCGLRRLADAELSPLFWEPERRGKSSTWWGHVPFAHWLIGAIWPRIVVELGTHHGVSYAAFCEAVKRHQLATRCFAVDTWKGDAHAAAYGEDVYRDLHAFHEPRYASFSTLLRGAFDAARGEFADGSVDLLHIDGLHTYEAVRHDFETWQPKLSGRGVVLFHDIEIRDRDFGVWRLWAELSGRYPHFAFRHSCGLGVLALGPDVPPALAALCAAAGTPEGDALRDRVAAIGARWEAEGQAEALLGSLSWRITEPLRWLVRRVRG